MTRCICSTAYDVPVIQFIDGNRRIIVMSRSNRQYGERETAYSKRVISTFTRNGIQRQREAQDGLPCMGCKSESDFLRMKIGIAGLLGSVKFDMSLVWVAGQASGQRFGFHSHKFNREQAFDKSGLHHY